jgi:hypothetical protein
VTKTPKPRLLLGSLARRIIHAQPKMPTISVDKAALFEALGREYADPFFGGGGENEDVMKLHEAVF